MKKFLCLLLTALLLCGCAAENIPAETTAATVPAAETAPVPVETTAGETEEVTLATEEETRPADITLHSGLREDGSFSEGTLFLGDSLTYGFLMYFLQPTGMVGSARFMAMSGAPMDYYWSASQRLGSGEGAWYLHLYSPEFEGLTLKQGTEKMGQAATAVYVLFGTNGSSATTAQGYIDLVDSLLDICPNATVFLQTIPPCLKEGVEVENVNARIRRAAEHFEEEKEYRVILLDTHAGWDEDCLETDGVHLNSAGRQSWYNTICTYARNQGLEE